MHHILDRLQTSAEDRWIIFGKGPSFNPQIEVDGFKICSLNEAANGLEHIADLTVCNDWPSLTRLYPGMHPLVATPSYNHNFAVDSQYAFSYLVGIMRAARRLQEVCLFDLRTTDRTPLFPHHAVVQAYNSSYETALILLARCGVKEIAINGIDGGTEYHPSFGVRTYPCTLDGQFQHAQKTIEEYGLNVVRLK